MGPVSYGRAGAAGNQGRRRGVHAAVKGSGFGVRAWGSLKQRAVGGWQAGCPPDFRPKWPAVGIRGAGSGEEYQRGSRDSPYSVLLSFLLIAADRPLPDVAPTVVPPVGGTSTGVIPVRVLR